MRRTSVLADVLHNLIVGRARCPYRAASARRCPKQAELDGLGRRAGDSAPDLYSCEGSEQRVLAPAATRSKASIAREYHLLCLATPTLRCCAAHFEDFLA